MIRLMGRGMRRLWLVAAVALVLAALALTGVRLALTQVERWRAPASDFLSGFLGHPVTLDGLEARLVGLSPRVRFTGMTVATEPMRPLRFAVLEVQVDLIRTLVKGFPNLESIGIRGGDLEVYRGAGGQWQVRGLEALNRGDPRPPARFLEVGELQLADSRVRLRDPEWDFPPPELAAVDLHMENGGGRHRIDLGARPSSGADVDPDSCPADARLRLLADLRGPGDDPGSWSGRAYLDLSGADLTALVPPGLVAPEHLPRLTQSAVLEVWAELPGGGVPSMTARLGVRGLVLPEGAWAAPSMAARPAAADRPAAAVGPTIDRLTAKARLKPSDDGWELALRKVAVSIAGLDLPDTALDLRVDRQLRPRRLDLRMSGVDLVQIPRWLALLSPAVSEPLHPLLERRPRGRVRLEGLSMDWPDAGPLRWRLALTGRGLGLDAAAGLPGLEGLDIRLQGDQGGGQAELTSAALDLDLRPIFERPLALTRLDAALGWRRGADDSDWVIAVPNLALGNPDVSAEARLTLRTRDPDAGGQPSLDLQAAVFDADGSQARRYLPVGIMHPDLVTWLNAAVVDGQVPWAGLVFRGPLPAFPFRDHEGRFELILDIEDGVLDFLPGWPRVREARARLHFLNQRLDIDVASARLWDTRLADVRSALPDLWGVERLPISGRSEGPLADGLRLLRETPLSDQLGALGQALEGSGRAGLELALDVPLVPGLEMTLDGRARFAGPVSLGLRQTAVKLDAVTGGFRFGIDSVSAEAISGQLWGQPVTLDIRTLDAGDPERAATEIRARGRLGVADLASRVASPAWGLLDGSLDLDLGVTLRAAHLQQREPPMDFTLGSSLAGLVIRLPEPLGKPAAQTRALAVSGTLVPERSLSLTGGMPGLAADLEIALDAAGPLVRGLVRVGPEAAAGVSLTAPADAEGIRVEGSLERVDADAWLRALAALAPVTGPAGEAGAPRERAAPGFDPGLDVGLDVRIGRFDLGALALRDLRVQADPGASDWDLRVEAVELAGRLVLPRGPSQRPWDLSLERLDLAPWLAPNARQREGGEPRAGRAGRAEGASGTQLPPLDLRVAELRMGEESLGSLSVAVRPTDGGLRVPEIDFRGLGDTRIRGRAQEERIDGAPRSNLRLGMESADTGPLMRGLDYADPLSAAPLTARVELRWPGALADFDLARSSGQITAEVGAGRLLAVEPGIGRILGFLNLGALQRRLSLDFSDLYDEGFGFERITAAIDLEPGKAAIRRFDMEGPAGHVTAEGTTDLVARTFDQTVTVEPRIGTSVAIASAVAGGPVVGAAVYLVDKAVGGAIDKLGSFGYRVTGPWGEPRIERQGWESFSAGTLVPESGEGRAADAGSPSDEPKGSDAREDRRKPENLFLE